MEIKKLYKEWYAQTSVTSSSLTLLIGSYLGRLREDGSSKTKSINLHPPINSLVRAISKI